MTDYRYRRTHRLTVTTIEYVPGTGGPETGLAKVRFTDPPLDIAFTDVVPARDAARLRLGQEVDVRVVATTTAEEAK